MTFTLPTAANVHFEVGYDFLVGYPISKNNNNTKESTRQFFDWSSDLVLKLFSYSAKETFYGSNKVDRNVINLLNLPKGQYSLTIYEPSKNLDDILGCSEFTFAAYVESYSACI